MQQKNSFKDRITFKPIDINEKVNQIKDSLQFYYNSDIKKDYKNSFSKEYKILKSHFPEIDFTYEGRIKNPNSVEEKIHRKLSQGNTGNIYDIYATKLVVHSVNDCKDEELLKEACYRISDFLTSYDENLIDMPDKHKDYIRSPKANNYQAIHLVREHHSDKLSDYCSEIHIRTFRMEENQKFGTASHLLSYKPTETLKKELCPTFLEIGKSGKTYELSKKASWEKYQSDYEALQEYFDIMKTI